MAVLKCKMCGGTMEITNESVAVCEYCDTKQTVPTVKDENLQGLFNRATALRLKCEFDKAEQLYEKIISADNTQAEAYWGLILCKYGIEYVEDPVSYKRVPTCHRASFESIVADDDYEAALDFADAASRTVYEAEAREIDRIQKEIIKLSQKEEPYDVFICYKETDESGKRTQDSVIANDIYYQLSQEGFKVFYAAITLEDKLGSAYEPCIFAALNSSKVMLAIGTKPEYFGAVWVKNEWSRYLKLMKKDRSKLLIPCYRDMDAYELPDEFAHLQAQDMSKIGFINDIVRGIKKVIAKDSDKGQTPVVTETVVTGAGVNIEPLLERAFMFLEDGDWQSADEYCEKVLDQDPKHARAYLGKLMADLKVREVEKLADCDLPFESNNNYAKAIRFGDETLNTFLNNCLEIIKDRNETNRLNAIYDKAVAVKDDAETEWGYKEAAKLFSSISGWKDADEQAKYCEEQEIILHKDKIYFEAKKKCESGDVNVIKSAMEAFESIRGWRDVDDILNHKEDIYTNITKNKRYGEALRIFYIAEKNLRERVLIEKSIEQLKEACEMFADCQGWLDSDEKVKSARKMIADHEIKILTHQKNSIENEMSTLGMFSGKRRKELEAQLQDVVGRLAKYGKN